MQNFDFGYFLNIRMRRLSDIVLGLLFVVVATIPALWWSISWIFKVGDSPTGNFSQAMTPFIAVYGGSILCAGTFVIVFVSQINKKYHNDNAVVFPTIILIARNNLDEYTVQSRHTKPVIFKLQNGDVKQESLVEVSAIQVSNYSEYSDDVMNTYTYFKRNNIVRLPLDKADKIQAGDRVTTAKQTLQVDYTGEKAFKLHVTKIERPVSANETSWHTVFEAK